MTIEHLNPNENFSCRECGETKAGNYFISPTLCKKCAAKRWSGQVEVGNGVKVSRKALGGIRYEATQGIPYQGRDANPSILIPALVGAVGCPVLGFLLGGFTGAIIAFNVGVFVMAGLYHVLNPKDKAARAAWDQAIDEKMLELAEARNRQLAEAAQFYMTPEWRSIRQQVIREDEHVCKRCGRKVAPGGALAVDHIKPRSKYPDLALVRENLQILCKRCNSSKGNREF